MKAQEGKQTAYDAINDDGSDTDYLSLKAAADAAGMDPDGLSADLGSGVTMTSLIAAEAAAKLVWENAKIAHTAATTENTRMIATNEINAAWKAAADKAYDGKAADGNTPKFVGYNEKYEAQKEL